MALFPVPPSTSLAGWGQPLLTQPASVLTGHYLWEEAQVEIWGEERLVNPGLACGVLCVPLKPVSVRP